MGEEAAHDAAAAPTPAAGDVGWGDAAADEQKSPGEPPGIFDGLDLSDEVKKRLLAASTSDTLNLEYQSLGPEGAGALAGALVGMGHLSTLELGFNKLGPGGVRALAGPLSMFMGITTLTLQFNSLGAEGGMALATTLEKMASLVTLNLSNNSLGSMGVGALAGALSMLPELTTLDLNFNDIGPEGASYLAWALERLPNMEKLHLSNNPLGSEGTNDLAGVLSTMKKLAEVDMDVFSTDVDWKAVSGFAPPTEVLEQGWIKSLECMRVMHEAGSEAFSNLRLLLIGCGTAGKTTLLRAMQSPMGRTEAISIDERTVAIDVSRAWAVEEGDGGLVFDAWDFGGQAKYHTSHSPYLSARCLTVLVFRPVDDEEQYLSGEKVMLDFVTMWLRMLHVHVPCASVVLVCTRWCSPPEGVALEEHQARVCALCEEVNKGVAIELERLNELTRSELGHLLAQEEEVGRSVAVEEQSIRERNMETQRRLAASFAGKFKCENRDAHRIQSEDAEAHDLKNLKAIRIQLQQRLRVITAERKRAHHCSLPGDESGERAVSMSLACGRVHCVEGVGGDGSTARAVRRVLVQCARALPFMHQSMPKGYTAIKDACLAHKWTKVAVPIDEAVQVLLGQCEGQTSESVRHALELWSYLGFMVMHDEWLVPRPTDLIDLVRPLVHHDPVGALDRQLSGRSLDRRLSGVSVHDISADWVVPDFAALPAVENQRVRRMVERLMDDNVLCEGLQAYLRGWKDVSQEQRDALLEVMVRFGLVVPHDSGSEEDSGGERKEREWLCTCRMDSRPGPKKWDEKAWKKFAGPDTPKVPVVRYTFEHAPSALFPHVVASQMSNWEYKAGYRRRTILEGGMLSAEIRASAMRHEYFQLALTGGDEEGSVQVVVVASSVGLIRSLCAAVERVVRRRFPGLWHNVEVHFAGEYGACVWRVGADMCLGGILARKEWDRSARVALRETGKALTVSVRDIFHAVPGIFFSHNWNDRSVEVGPVLRDLVESRMRELVWYDAQVMSTEDQFQSRMAEGVKNSWAVFIFLSREALASGNCLREMCLAREQQLDPKANTRVILLAMEEEVTYAQISAWPDKSLSFTSKDGQQRTVHARTIKWVQEHLLGVNIYPEWVKGAGQDPAKQRQAIDRIIENLRKPLVLSSDRNAAPEFEVVKMGDVWILGTKRSASFSSEGDGGVLPEILQEFLAENELVSTSSALLHLGVEAVSDLAHLDDKALEEAGLKKVQVLKLRSASLRSLDVIAQEPQSVSGCCTVS